MVSGRFTLGPRRFLGRSGTRRSLFDWTVRNMQLDEDRPDRIPQFPWETLLFGHGTPVERAWVFILLLRQADIDAAVIALDGNVEKGAGKDAAKAEKKSAKSKKTTESAPRPWCVGVRIEKNVYLFDPLLGLPIPAPGRDAGTTMALRSSRPRWPKCAADDKLLRRMEVNESWPDSVKASDLSRVTALLEASPAALSERMKRLESGLTGEQKLALTTSPTASAEHWKAAAGIAAAQAVDVSV